MNSGSPQDTMLGYVLIIAVAVIVIGFRMRRISSGQPLKVEQLWIVPAIYAVVSGMLYWRFPPQGIEILWCAIAFLIGAAAGWQHGRTLDISVDRETNMLNRRASPATMMFLLAIIGIRYGVAGADPTGSAPWHGQVMLATDVLIAFALGLLVTLRAQMHRRAKALLGA